MRRHKQLTLLLASLVACGLLFSGGRGVEPVSALPKKTYENIELLTNILNIVQRNYVDEVSFDQMFEGAITGMLTSLDPHSAYLTPDLYRELQVDTKGSFGGLGIEIAVRNGLLTVVSPIEDTPAYRAGIQAGDHIVKINGELTKDLTLIEAVKKMRGRKGTKISITIAREGVSGLIDVTVVREVIKIRSVKSRWLDPGYGYVRITQFQERTADDLREALDAFTDDEPIQGIVLDLRNNPGGLLSQAVHVADLFLDSGLVVYTDGRLESQRQKYYAHKAGTLDGFPMVVLVNGGSASASEIVAGALQDHKRAIVLGTQTFGKGSVQTILPLEENAALRLTTARYYTPNGRPIQATGIEPDILLENAVLVAKAEQDPSGAGVREADLPRHLEAEGGESQSPSGTAVEGGDAPDPQLAHALELLKSWRVFERVFVARGQSREVAVQP
jgi:carboxyl-terminal processing protease